MADFDFEAVKNGLIVFVPGTPARRGRHRAHSALLERLRLSLDGTGWHVESYEHEFTVASRGDLDEVVNDLAGSIRQWAGEISPDVKEPEAIIIVGHSFGGVLARAAFVRDAREGESGRAWTQAVRRIVLLGSPNAGFRWNSPGTPRLWRLLYPLVTLFGDFAIEKVNVGGFWITNLRLQWLETFRSLQEPPRVVQVLGTHDDFVTKDDVLDTRFMPDTVKIEIPEATHVGLVDLSLAKDKDVRFAQLHAAICGRDDEKLEPTTDVVDAPTFFILHGIRDSAYRNWVQNLSAAMMKLPGNVHAKAVCPDTGFFSALEFAVPGARKHKVHEFLKLYGDAYSERDPNAFVFAGHSNGTYMMAQALDRVPAMRFKRIYLAGTVLPRDFAWQTLMERGQVGSYTNGGWSPGVVRNDRATRDVPVGILCSWLNGLGSRDVGTAGFSGFENAPSSILDGNRAYDGGHGAALISQERLDSIAAYLTTGDGAFPPIGEARGVFEWFSRLVGNPITAWAIVALILAAVAAGILAIVASAGLVWAIGTAAAIVVVIAVLLLTI